MAFPQTVRWINEILNNLSQVRLFLVPSGGVILWHGASNAVPKGWAICDGTNGTPDLRDRFVIGAGGKYGLDATGGAASATPDVTAGTAKRARASSPSRFSPKSGPPTPAGRPSTAHWITPPMLSHSCRAAKMAASMAGPMASLRTGTDRSAA